jgi:hypothetical protein
VGEKKTMKILMFVSLVMTFMTVQPDFTGAVPGFGLQENALGEFKALRYENVYTKVPTSGKLVAIKITDSGKIYYICKEKSGYVIYNLEIRPPEGFQEKIQQELKKKTRNWAHVNPDDLVFTKEIFERELKRQLSKDSEAVWVRNEIIIEDSGKSRSSGQ